MPTVTNESCIVTFIQWFWRRIRSFFLSAFTFRSSKKLDKGNKDSSEEYVEGVVCNLNDLQENELKAVDLNDRKVLLVKQKGVISAIGAKCTHYGAPLVSSALGDGRVRCQWHGACFNILTGDIEDFPGLDSLPCYKVTIENDKVKVRARKSELSSNKRTKEMAKRDLKDDRHVVVIGGGPSGATCVETLRQEGFTGQISFVCKEKVLPYDRVKVSKSMDFDIEKSILRDETFYKTHDIDVFKGVEAIAVKTDDHNVILSNGKTLKYDKLYIATGSNAKKLKIPGSDLKNVIVLRNVDDAKYTLSQLSEDKEVVVLGSSFIAMEGANYCQNKSKKVTVIFRGELPFQPLLGPEVGKAFMKLFEEKGVHFVTKNTITEIRDDGKGNVTEVVLKDGSTLKADIVIMGVGSTLATEFLKESGIEIRPDGSIETDEYLQTNIPDVLVGGDIAYAPVWSHNNQKASIGHYPLAHYHGKIAGLNLLDKKTPLKAVPYFWTMLYGKGIRYAGHGDYDEIIYHGDVSGFKFVAFYIKDGVVVSTSSCGMDPVVSQFAELLAQGKTLTKEDLKGDDLLAWRSWIVPK
ncbi:apoptosis-inducing factor 3-like isoform X1 [Diorhabda carinulata]|uniref:apoptosis-inducing factor 3-like isoform X1 n=1 Tax=Diorhabda carinulata TaxID=1163345 RepID=UPI00259FF442|nr:apoptosis-inducing factor 3-like isoform X1 [Diorhabda carinulata]XP_057654677.1 apoptosis-inducing factor 3-like isoform X1 [Diorhabda carinulata]XP_057654678.1 apoptosis-inducing factor 3-like isoform X1 [Diorhabda carinulata]XP_057654679.1 apoptosis-inducing factor 3-like isoform X1 [Diorhabda carinulata]XP_057654680.1 apoptosis-inducing factor 3-like isoform X1 [Diorhabda carinulata]XP_057654681.1 apoptosis-inducing factor 3-like isoform X1 [Diorhabda carinulata]